MTFPADRLAMRIEAALGAVLTDSPNGWTWTDLSSYIFGKQSIAINRGRPNEASLTNPTTMGVTLDNISGDLSPRNTGSPFYPNLKRNTPVRIWVEGAEAAAYLPGADGSYISTPHAANLGLTGNEWDIRMRIQPLQWAGIAGDYQILISKGANIDDLGYLFGLNPQGRPIIGFDQLSYLYGEEADPGFGDGTNDPNVGQVAALHPMWIAGTYEQTTEGPFTSNAYARWYTWAGDPGETPPADVTTWDEVSFAVDLFGFGPAGANTQPVEIGSANGGIVDIGDDNGPGFEGFVYALEMRSTINGTLVADPDFASASVGDPSVTDSFGNVWTLNGDAAITTDRVKFSGRMDDLEVLWPIGDNDTGGANGSECWTNITAAGILRRLGQGESPTRSPIYRSVTNPRRRLGAAILPDGYWSWEERDGAQLLAAGLGASASDITLSGWEVAADDTLAASEPLPTLQQGDNGSWSCTVTGSDQNPIQITWLMRLPTPETSPTSTLLLSVLTTGTVAQWDISVDDTNITVEGFDSGSGSLFSSTGATGANMFGPWVICHFDITQGSGQVNWEMRFRPIDGSTDYPVFGVYSVGSPTRGEVTGLEADNTGPPDGLSMGHLVVAGTNAYTDGWLDPAVCGYIGETAAARFYRVATEEGIPAEVIGDNLRADSTDEPLGAIGLSQPMGPQPPGTVLEVLQSCVDTDGGILVSRPGTPGLVFRTRKSLEGQRIRLALSGATPNRYLRSGLAATNDDLLLRNDVTVKTFRGSTVRLVDQDHIDANDVYDEEVELNTLQGVDLLLAPDYRSDVAVELANLVNVQGLTIAQRKIHFGTWDGDRWRAIMAEMAIGSGIIGDWHLLQPGDRFTLEGLPGQYPLTEPVDLIAEGLSETMSATAWSIMLSASPAGPWVVEATTIGDTGIASDTVTTNLVEAPTSLSVVGSPEWEYAVGNPTVTNPDPNANSNTVLAIALGQGTANAPTITITPPPGVTATELTGLAVTTANIRVRAWTYPNDGAASKTFGYSAGSDNRTDAILIPLDGTADTVIEGGTPITGNGPTLGFPTVVTQVDDLVIPFAGRRPVSATPGTLTGYTVIDDDTAEGDNPKGVAWEALATGTSTTPPNVTWSSGAGEYAHAVVAFRGAGAGAGSSPPAARIANANLTIDLDATDSSTWDNTRSEGQWQIGGGVFNPGADDSFGPLVWEVDDQTILWSQNMQDGTDEILQADTFGGIAVVNTARQYVVDGSYLTPAQAGDNHGYADNPPSMTLYFDGTRATMTHSAIPQSVGGGAIPLVVGLSWVVEEWMFADDWTAGPWSLHSPTIYHTGPIGATIRDGEVYLSGKYSLTDIDPDSTVNLPTGWESTTALALPAVGEWFTMVVEFVVDPGGSGYYDWYRLDHTLGTMHLVQSRGNDFGWKFDEADPSYTNQNDNFYFNLPSQYEFHQYTPAGITENWDAAGATAAGATFPNVRRFRWAYASAAQAATVEAAEMIGHAKYFLSIT